jgi:pimeloyl-ACP methyl ester carboxylesterase
MQYLKVETNNFMKLWSETIIPSSQELNGQSKSHIVFLHGTGSNARMWKNQVSYFSRLGYPCTLIDLRGHGQSHEPYEKTDLVVHTQDVLDTLQNSKIKFPAYFVGHSLGAIVALSIAEKHPSLVKAVYAACAPGRLVKPVQFLLRIFLNGPFQALKESRVKHFLPWRERTLVEMPTFTMKEIANFFRESDLLTSTPKVSCPVHIGAARFDPLAIHGHSKMIHSKLPESTFQTFEWAGHNVMDYRTNDFNSWILGYLE